MPAIADNGPIVLPGIGGRPPIEIDKKLLCQVIQPRMEEILEIAAMEIKRSGYSKHLSAGVVLTGGGSLIKGTADLAREVLGMPVKIGIPSGFSAGLIREIENPIYATGVGLVVHELKHRDRSAITSSVRNGKGKGSVKNIFNRMRTWFDEL
jgi:cell division protein FtsA